MTASPSAQWGPQSSLDRVYDALAQGGYRPAGRTRDFMALCPAHEEKTPSLHVTYSLAERGGQVALWCHGCRAEARDIAGALGLTMADLFDNPPPQREERRFPTVRRAAARRGRLGPLPAALLTPEPPDHQHSWSTNRTYDYTDSHGEIVQQVIREQCKHCQAKQFKQAFTGSDGELHSHKPDVFTPVIYRQPEVVRAVEHGVPVWVLEGEKDAETAEELGLVATTNPGGAGSFPAEAGQLFRGADVRIVLDRDDAGWARGADLHRKLFDGGALRIQYFLPATTASKSDLTDHVQAGHGVDDLCEVRATEVHARAALGSAHAALGRLLKCEGEARARMELSTARRTQAPKEAEDHARYASRWAKESEIRWERVAEAAEDVLREVEQSGGEDIDRVAQDLDAVLLQADAAVRAAHESGQREIPADVTTRCSALRARAIPPGGGGKVLDLPAPVAEEPSSKKQQPASGQVDWPEYAYLDGGLVRVKWEERGRGEDTYRVPITTPIINLAIHLDAVELTRQHEEHNLTLQNLQDAHGTDRVSEMPVVAAHVYSWPDAHGEGRQQVRIPWSEARTGDWLDTIPVPGINFARDRKGRGEVVRAIAVVSSDTQITTQYRGTGWYEHSERGWCYSHYAGTITSEGHLSTPAVVTGALTRYALPVPTQDPTTLRRAFEQSVAIMRDLHPSGGAVLLGIAYKAALERVPYSAVISGSAGTGKTGLAALVQHHYGPAWDRTAPTGSMTGNGATPLAMRIAAHESRDALGFFDDVTPSSAGGYAAAQTRLGEFIQSLYNQEARDYSSREHTLMAGKRPWVTAVFTSEVPPRMGANARRAINIPLIKGEISIDRIIELDEMPSRMARAQLTSSLIQWAAADLPGQRAAIAQHRVEYMHLLRAAGATNEEAEWGGHVWSGWVTMTTFLRQTNTITAHEQEELLGEVHQSIGVAMDAASDADDTLTPGARVLEALRGGLRSGELYLTDVTTNAQPAQLANRLGWMPAPFGSDQDLHSGKLQYSTRGRRMGYVNIDAGEVLIDNRDLERAVKDASAGLAEPLTMDAGTIRRALGDIGALRTERKAAGGVAFTVKRTIPAEIAADGTRAVRRVVAISLLHLLGEEPDEPDDPHGRRALPPMPWSPAGTSIPSPPPRPTSLPSAEDPQEDPMPDPAAGTATRMNEPAECVWCRTPTIWALDGVPLHSRCWGDANRQADSHDRPAPAPEAPATTPRHKPAVRTPEPAPSSRPTPQPITSTSPTPAVVVSADGIYFADGTRRDLPEITHLGHLAELARTLRIGVPQRRGYLDAGTIVISASLCTALGLPADLPKPTAAEPRLPEKTFEEETRDHPLLLAALEDGWRVSARQKGGLRLRGWTFMWREDIKVRLAFESFLSDTITGDGPTPSAIARRLARFADTMRVPWHVSPSATGLDLMEHLQYRRREELFTRRDPDQIVQPARVRALEAEINWSRPPTKDELALPYVHVYDRGGSHLAGVSSLELPIGDPEHHDGPLEFDPSRPGYWRIRVPDSNDWRIPHPLAVTHRQREFLWVTTPTLDLASFLDYEPEILEAYTWPAHGRILDPWYTRIRDARTSLDTDDPDDQTSRTLIKELYTRTIGMLGSDEHQGGGRFYAPERRHHIIAKARSNLLRQVVKIGRENGIWPLAIRNDAILYASSEPDPFAAWPGDPAKFGRGLGQYKAERTGLMTEQAPFLTGGPWDPARKEQALTPVTKIEKGSE